LLWNSAGISIALIAIIAALCFWASSAGFENLVRRRIVAQLETATGGRVEVRSFQWNLIALEAEAGGVVIHGLEESGESPYAQLERLRVRLSVLGLLSPHVLLRDLSIVRPRFHLILYPDGTTNQPHPRTPQSLRKPALETLFDIQAGHIAVEQGWMDIDDREAAFDFQNRFQTLDFQANDASLLMQYVPAAGNNPESYHIETGGRDLNVVRGSGTRLPSPPLHGYLQATLDIMHNAAFLRSLRITSSARGVRDRTLEVSGTLTDFARPRWVGKSVGELDLRILDPVFGYPFAPEGIARIHLDGAGQAGEFRLDGTVHIEDGAYIQPGVSARDLTLDTKVHADPSQLRITAITAHFKQGGQMHGEVLLDHWLPPIPGEAVLQPNETASVVPSKPNKFWNRHKAPVPPPPPKPHSVAAHTLPVPIPVNGKVKAEFENVSIDTVLDMVGQEPFKRLGIDARLNGLSTAEWVKGDVNTLVVSSALNVSPSAERVPNEVAANGAIEGTYTQRDGAVDLRRLELDLPGSQIQAHGLLGAYPLTSRTDMSFDLRSRNLSEFDTVLRDLGLTRNGKSGTAALPVTLGGQLEYHGNWAGSLYSPRLAGDLKATQFALEVPSNPGDKSGKPQYVPWDAAEAAGSYSAERIAITHAQLNRGPAQIVIDGTLSATDAAIAKANASVPSSVPKGELPAFDADSLLHAHVHGSQIALSDLLPLAGVQAPVTGTLDTQFSTDGPMSTLTANGWAELTNAVAYGEPIARVRAQGTVANKIIKLSSISLNEKAGSVNGSGSYDIGSQRFQAEAHASGIDISRIERMHAMGETLAGKLEFSATASGTMDDPRLEGHASLDGLAVSGQTVGGLELTAHTVDQKLIYDISSHIEAAELNGHGETGLHGDYPTQAKVAFSRFNIGAIFKLAHVEGISGESALSGTASVHGPLARPDQLQGEARLQSMAMTVAGVHLQSEGGMHATLANARVTLDPLHITGEQTDLRAEGALSLKDTQRVDFKASGSINLKLAETIDSDLTAGGTTTFQVEAHGPLANPGLRGRVDFDNGSLALEDVPNGLSQLHGTLEFNQNRLEVRSLTAMTGGGQLSVGGYLAYQRGVFADLSVTCKSIRIRYPQGVSSLADATLHLQGTQNNLLLSGNVMLTRFSVSPDIDIAAMAAQANAVAPVAAPDAPSNHVRLDVRIQSSPQLNFQNAYAKLAGDVDLRLRGTVATPSLLGRVSITEGNAIIAGTRYELQRGDILFTNPVRIQPTIDINATARVEDYDITLGLHGTPDKLGITYRSDPPLPEADVVALLALGRTQSEQGIYTEQQQQSAGLAPSTDVLLGGALNATVSSRVQKLFGAGSVKVDPSYLGALGNSTTRITVDEQLGKNITLTYATNVDTSAQQLLQAEIAVNRHVSLLVARDESGVFSMVIKATRRYR
jgi:translocation and assembly module TamB